MPELVVYRSENGKLAGHGEKGGRAWSKFLKLVKELAPGDTMAFSYRIPRSPKHHKFFFALMGELFDRQEAFEDREQMMDWIKVGAGHVDFVPGLDGVMVALPRSINWASLDEQEFIEVHRAVRDFLWTPHAQAFLWPHMRPKRRQEAMEWLLESRR